MNRHYNGFIFEDRKTGSDYLIAIQVEENRYIGVHAAYPIDGDHPYYSNAQFVKFPDNIRDLVASIKVKKADFIPLFFVSDHFFRVFTYPNYLDGLEKALARNLPNASPAAAKATSTDLEYQFYSACDKLFAQPLSDLRGLTLSQYNQK